MLFPTGLQEYSPSAQWEVYEDFNALLKQHVDISN